MQISAISSSRQFSYDKASKTFSADMSDFRIDPIGRIYNDACDVGIIMESERTGKQAKFVLEHEFRDADQDITHWVLYPTTDAFRQNPRLAGCKVIIFND